MLSKSEFKILRDKFITNSDYLDRQHLERSALTASQFKWRIDQSRENLKIVRKESSAGTLARCESSSNYTRIEHQRVKAPKELLEANARWIEEHRDAAKNDIR